MDRKPKKVLYLPQRTHTHYYTHRRPRFGAYFCAKIIKNGNFPLCFQDDEEDDKESDQNPKMLRNGTRSPSPPERPNWGFGPSRAPTRMEDMGYLNG